MDLPSDVIDLWVAFDDEKVEALLIGGQALAVHGHPRFTKDWDVWVRDTPENIQRVRAALLAFGAPRSVIEGIESARDLDVVWMGHPPARVDIVKNVPGGVFDDAWRSRFTVAMGGARVVVVGREELIRLKRASGRAQDLVDADLLSQSRPERS